MAKFCGNIGYVESVETKPGVWKNQIQERKAYGDLVRNNRRLQSTDQLNDNVTVSNEISIVADPFARNNFHSIRYVVWRGGKWKVSNIEVQPPRLILTLGGIYNGD